MKCEGWDKVWLPENLKAKELMGQHRKADKEATIIRRIFFIFTYVYKARVMCVYRYIYK